MISLQLDTKKSMSELLLRETFHKFLLIEGEITTFNKFTIDGYIHQEFYGENKSQEPEADLAVYSTWENLQEYCLSIIKGKHTPLNFRFIFCFPPAWIAKFIASRNLDFRSESVQGLYLNFRYDGKNLTCTTGTALNSFTLDKSLEHAFDAWAKEFFAARGIEFSEG